MEGLEKGRGAVGLAGSIQGFHLPRVAEGLEGGRGSFTRGGSGFRGQGSFTGGVLA